jgi:hypothetical protein
MPEIPPHPSGPRRRANALTTTAGVLALALAVVWLHASGVVAPAVPAGLPAAGSPDAAARQERLGTARQGPRGMAPDKRHGTHRMRRRGRAQRAGGGAHGRAPRGDRGARERVGSMRQGPPAAAMAPEAGRVAPAVAPPAVASPSPASPEFALG